jgi:hypothetical protein
MPDRRSQEIEKTNRGEKQLADEDRAPQAAKTEPGHMPKQKINEEPGKPDVFPLNVHRIRP